jgi:hypothetical protein
MLVLLALHLSMNHAAVRAVSMRSLNRQRANIVLSHLIAHDKILTPQQVSKRERIFEKDGVLRWNDDSILGYGMIGIRLQTLARGLVVSNNSTKFVQAEKTLSRLLDIYKDESYVLWFDRSLSVVYITLKRDTSPESQLKAWCQGLLIAKEAAERTESEMDTFVIIADTLKRATKLFDQYAKHLKAEGWDLSIAALETHSGTRLDCKQQKIISTNQRRNRADILKQPL